MLVLIDESGETGFKAGSSRYFILTMVVFRMKSSTGQYVEAERAAEAIKACMKATRQKPEFHFTDCSNRNREAFFTCLNEEKIVFDVYALVVDKNLITENELRKNSRKFYNYFLMLLLTHNPISDAVIKVDGKGSKVFRLSLESYLRKDRPDLIKKFKMVDSKKDVLIQLADMVCGAIAYSHNRTDLMGADRFIRLLDKRIKNVWHFK